MTASMENHRVNPFGSAKCERVPERRDARGTDWSLCDIWHAVHGMGRRADGRLCFRTAVPRA